ncbi:alpha/beta fold hydrolase [Halapricum hydrolyticum]|uniref:Alpha/beta hydrolase n=1 Tax=Halapricum hydrolyticum TaxID=2979991 RepID=A0AAE3I9Q7_9EURY|nr:alpha/beta hydrolase [Halapricum hydrolyticum]MCU4717084.1 alpha/beta hydrolase [Halapricum hydrolyticum]MCU4726011.1 alpha/beta hydrolase [Halapricum hydrolyticum]
MTERPVVDTSVLGAPSAEHTFREVNGLTLHTVAAGDTDDPLVVLLHGFPEFWYEWRGYVKQFVDAGYRVLVPDQRGYNRSDKPAGVRSYRISELSRDVVDLVATEDRETAHVVGHDWGAAVAWDVALRYPEVVDRLGIINVPHPRVFEAHLTSNLTQLRKSWYMFYFQVPWLPERLSRRNEYRFMTETMRSGSLPETFSEMDFDRYRRAWDRNGALTAMINWYRALFRYREAVPREQVQAPTLILWGDNDQALVPEMAAESLVYCPDGRLERFPEATHWVPHEYPGRVADLLLDHLR